MKKQVTIWSNPILWLQTWYGMHMVSVSICGKWSGVKLHADGRMEIRSNEVFDYMMNFAEEVEE